MTQLRKTGGALTYLGTAIADRLVSMVMSDAFLVALHCREKIGR